MLLSTDSPIAVSVEHFVLQEQRHQVQNTHCLTLGTLGSAARHNFVFIDEQIKTEHPSYLHELLQFRRPSRSLRSSNHNLLNIPRPRTAFVQRSFAHAAPHVWNSLPHTITDDLNISAPVFKSRLETFLYRRSYQ